MDWNPAELLKLSGSYWNTCPLHAGVKLELFTRLGDRQLSAAELAAELGIPERGLAMLLDALSALELLVKEGDNYRATPAAGRFLNSTSPAYLGHIINHHHHLVEYWSHLDVAVREGGPVRERISHQPSEAERESFLMGMFNLAMLHAPKLAEAVDLAGHKRLLDLGGGPGSYAIHFCQQTPGLEAVIFDLPTTRPFAEQTVASFGLSERISFAAGDFTSDPLPGRFDVVWISQVLHGEGPEGCARLVAKAAEALEPGGLLLVQEFILAAERDAPLFPALFSLNMLLGTPNGQSYSEPEIAGMLRAAGLEDVKRIPMESPQGVGIMAGRKP